MKPALFSNFIGLSLQNACNADCAHCYRPEEKQFKLSYAQVSQALEEIAAFQASQGLGGMNFYFTGGEAALWKDGTKTLTDLLLDVANNYKAKPQFDTNGFKFRDPEYCRRFLGGYFERSNQKLALLLSCDYFHQLKDKKGRVVLSNLDREATRIIPLDNILEFAQKEGLNQRIEIELMWVTTNSTEHCISSQLMEKYSQHANLRFTIAPLKPTGRRDWLDKLCPGLQLHDNNGFPSSERSSLGAFLPHLERELRQRGRLTEASIDALTNEQIFTLLDECGRAPNPLFCWQGSYYFCLSRVGDKDFLIGPIGQLIQGAKDFNHPWVEGMRKSGVLSYLQQKAAPHRLQKSLCRKHHLRFVGCSLCADLVDKLP